MSEEFDSFFERLGKVWVPMINPPELGTVPLDAGRVSDAELSDWLGKCTAWYAYAQSQLGLVEARKLIIQRRFNRLINDKIVEQVLKQRTYELQVAAAIREDDGLIRLQEEITELEAQGALWSRMSRAYESYAQLFQRESDKRRWSREKGG